MCLQHRNSSISLKDTIHAFNMIKDFQDCSLKMQLVHRLVFKPTHPKKPQELLLREDVVAQQGWVRRIIKSKKGQSQN